MEKSIQVPNKRFVVRIMSSSTLTGKGGDVELTEVRCGCSLKRATCFSKAPCKSLNETDYHVTIKWPARLFVQVRWNDGLGC